MTTINDKIKNGEVYIESFEESENRFNKIVQDAMINNLKEKQNKSDATIESVCDALKEFLLAKNKNYGNSATEPLNIFSNLSNIERMKCRMDEKISRIKNSPCDRVNDYVDLLGYLVLVCKLKGWDSFMDMVD